MDEGPGWVRDEVGTRWIGRWMEDTEGAAKWTCPGTALIRRRGRVLRDGEGCDRGRGRRGPTEIAT